MYNMEISIGSYKVRLEILLLIILALWIIFGSALLGCSNISLKEGLRGRIAKQNTATQSSNVVSVKADEDYGSSLVATGPGSTATSTSVEGFINSNNAAFGPEFSESKSPGYILPPEQWSMPTLEYSKGTTPSIGAEAILDRPAQPIPLPEGQLDFLATTPFKSECCPSAFSTSTGCACLTMDQYQYLHERGGNNVPFSQY
jgi:hypothetical protein